MDTIHNSALSTWLYRMPIGISLAGDAGLTIPASDAEIDDFYSERGWSLVYPDDALDAATLSWEV